MKEDLEKAHQEIDFYSDVDDEECLIKFCSYFTLYQKGSLYEKPEEHLNFYQQGIDLIRPHATFFDVDGKWKYKKIRKDTFDLFPFWVSKNEDKPYGIRIEAGRFPEEVSEYAFQFSDETYIRFVLPIEFLFQSPDSFVELVKKTVGNFEFYSGHAGIGTNTHHNLPGADPDLTPIYALSRRYRGVDWGFPQYFGDLSEFGIKGVNWLTLVGEEWVEQLGGIDSIKKNFSASILVHELPHGILIQAGPRPELGYVNSEETLPLYHEVGAALQPLRIPDEHLTTSKVGGYENTRAWLDRFYPDY